MKGQAFFGLYARLRMCFLERPLDRFNRNRAKLRALLALIETLF